MRISSLTGARIAVAAAFFAQGFVFISLTTRLPRFLEQWGMDEVALSLLLLMMVLLAGVGSLVAERAAHRLGSAPMLRLGLALMVVAVPTITIAPAMAFFVGGVALYGIALGLVDATTNMQAVDLEHRYGRPILPSSHGYWTTGGITAAIIALATGHLSPEVGAVVAVVPLAIAFARFLPRVASGAETPGLVSPVLGLATAGAGSPGVGSPGTVSTSTVSTGTSTDATPVPWRPIWLVGAGLVVFYMVDTTASAWGPVYLARSFDAPGNLVALATFPYLVTSIVVRLAGGQLVTRFGVVPLLRIGAVVACGALTLVALAPTWQVAVAGFTILGAAVALVAPLSFSAAGRIASGPASDAGFRAASGRADGRADGEADGRADSRADGGADGAASRLASATTSGTADAAEPDRARTDAVIARFNQFNYVGALLGSVLTGFVGAENLRLGFALPAVLVLALVPLAPSFARGALSRR